MSAITQPPARPVAVIGLGRMGAAMVERLRALGTDVVIFNRTASRAADLAERSGARVAPTAAAAASGAGVVLVSLADDAACRETYTGSGGLVDGLAAGTVVAETSTIDPRTVVELAGRVSATGAALVDSPVSGSVPLVLRGELTAIVGGAPDAVGAARPVLEGIAKHVLHVGPLGAGATMKLAVNGVVHASNQAVSEALVLAEAAGVDRQTAYEVLASSAIASPFVAYKRGAFENPAEAPVAFSLDLVAKDYDLILELAERVGARMDQARAGRRSVAAAIERGYGNRDMSALAEHLRDLGGS